MKHPYLRTFLRVAIFGLAALVTLIVLFYTWTGYAGRREWEKTRDELMGRGELPTFEELMGPEIPDYLNFYATPYWEEVFAIGHDGQVCGLIDPLQDFVNSHKVQSPLFSHSQRTVDDALDQPVATSLEIEARLPVLAEIREAAKRPGARAPLVFKDYFTALPHITPVLRFSLSFSALAYLKMKEGDAAAAARDIQVIFQLADVLGKDPMLIAMLVRISSLRCAIQTFFECNAIGAFDETELRDFQSRFESVNLGGHLGMALRGEQAMFNAFADSGGISQFIDDIKLPNSKYLEGLGRISGLGSFYPSGFVFEDRARFNRMMAHAASEAESGRRPDLVALAPKPTFPFYRGLFAARAVHGFSTAGVVGPSIQFALKWAFAVQTQLRLAATACAIERFRLARGRLPDSLQELVPDFLSAVPTHPSLSDEEVRYVREGDAYELSLPVADEEEPRGFSDGRWVWPKQ